MNQFLTTFGIENTSPESCQNILLPVLKVKRKKRDYPDFEHDAMAELEDLHDIDKN